MQLFAGQFADGRVSLQHGTGGGAIEEGHGMGRGTRVKEHQSGGLGKGGNGWDKQRCWQTPQVHDHINEPMVLFTSHKAMQAVMTACTVPGELKRLFAVVRATSSRGPAKAKLFVEDMI